MERPGELIGQLATELKWPSPNEDGTTTLSKKQLATAQALVSALVGYIDAQLSRCEKKDDAAAP